MGQNQLLLKKMILLTNMAINIIIYKNPVTVL